ncbi:fimbrial assembly protein [Deinococcus detaillensis]|uniref:Fimbrial assembly protein n=1 Tax=Deinococcus detaillensis TaxID=2592048 RepID=A0A553V6J5_9DEIO|nr:fimbrial assembly protein [Deinococcus detaillensis]TSA88046.1 fimbrial assembly protein [Deinococcus detaillensis]
MVEINLLPAQYRKRTEPNVWLYAGVAAVAVTLLAVAIPEIVVATQVGNLQKRLDDENGQISGIEEKDAPEFRRLTADKARLTAISQTATSLSSGKTYWSTDLAQFVAQLPQNGGVALSSLNMHQAASNTLYNGKPASKEYDLSGTALSTSTLVGFLNAYDQDKYGVNFKSTQRNTATNNFDFTASIGQLAGTPVSAAATTTPTTPANGTPANVTPTTPAPAAPAAPTSGATQ